LRNEAPEPDFSAIEPIALEPCQQAARHAARRSKVGWCSW
jgi:hypothetical protein